MVLREGGRAGTNAYAVLPESHWRGYRSPQEPPAARAANAEPWEPMPGMVKRECPECRYLFAAPVDSAERRCPDCVAAGTRSVAEPLATD
jgi:hypothetical protein